MSFERFSGHFSVIWAASIPRYNWLPETMGVTCGEEAVSRVFALSPPLVVRYFEMTVGSVSNQRRPSRLGFVDRPQSSRFMATKLDEISRVGIENYVKS